EERVVVEAERHRRLDTGLGVAPEDALLRVDEQHPVVPAVSDQQIAGNRAGRRERYRSRTGLDTLLRRRSLFGESDNEDHGDADRNRSAGAGNPERPAATPLSLLRASPAPCLEVFGRWRAQWMSSGRGQRRLAVRGRRSLAATSPGPPFQQPVNEELRSRTTLP